jgi:hypothetical protein
VGNEYKLDSETGSPPTQYGGAICQLEDNRLCVWFSDDQDGGSRFGVMIINIESDGLDVDSVSSFTGISPVGEAEIDTSGDVEKVNTNQVVCTWIKKLGADEAYGIAITFDGDNIDSQGSATLLEPSRVIPGQAKIVSKGDGTFIHLCQDVVDNPSIEAGKYTVNASNVISHNYKVNGIGAYAGVLADHVVIKYSSFNDFYVAGILDRLDGLTVWVISDSGSALTFGTEDTWTGIDSLATSEVGLAVLADGTAMGIVKDNGDSNNIKTDFIKFTGTTANFDGQPYLHDETNGAAVQGFNPLDAIECTNGNLFYSWGVSDGAGSNDRNISRIYAP